MRMKEENQDGMESYVEEQSKRRKYRSRRHRVCIMYTIMSMVLKILFYNVFSFCCSGSALNKYIKILDIRTS